MCLNNLRPSSTYLRLHGSGYPHALPRVTLPSSFPLLTLVPIFPRLASPEIDILSHASGPWVAKFDLNHSPADVQVSLSSRGRSRRRWGGIALAFHVALVLPVCLDSAVQTSLPSSSTSSHCYCWGPHPYTRQSGISNTALLDTPLAEYSTIFLRLARSRSQQNVLQTTHFGRNPPAHLLQSPAPSLVWS